MKKILLLIFLILTTSFISSQDKSSQEVKEVVNQFLTLMLKNKLTRQNIDTYVEPFSFKPEKALEDYFNPSEEGSNYEKLVEIAIAKEVLKFILERYTYEIDEIEKVNKYEYLVNVSFRIPLAPLFLERMFEYIADYMITQLTEENRAKMQSLQTIEERIEFLKVLVIEGIKEFEKTPLRAADFINTTYTFRVARVNEKDKFRIIFASQKELNNFYKTVFNWNW